MPTITNGKVYTGNYDHLVTRHLMHKGIEYRITHVGRSGDYVQCSEVGVVSDEILRIPIADIEAKLIDRTANKK